MTPATRRERSSLGDGGAPREYGAAVLLASASALLGLFVAAFVNWLRHLTGPVLDPDLVGAVVYAGLGTGALVVAALLVQRRSGGEAGLASHERTQLAGAAALLLFVVAYVLRAPAGLPAVPDRILASLLVGLFSFVIPALAYARLRGVALRLAAPTGAAQRHLVGAVLAAVLAGALYPLSVLVLRPARVAVGGVTLNFAPDLGALFGLSLVPALAVGGGAGLLFAGVLQQSLREHVGLARAAAVATTVLAGSVSYAGAVPTPFRLRSAAIVVATAVAAVLAGAVAAGGLAVLERRADVDPTPEMGAALGALVVGTLGLVGGAVAGAFVAITTVVVGLGAAVAAVGYARARTVWVPAAAFAAFSLLSDGDLALYLADLLG